jgi:hypothetical protein
LDPFVLSRLQSFWNMRAWGGKATERRRVRYRTHRRLIR